MAGMGNIETWFVGQQDTVIAALDRAVAAHPDRILLDFGGETYSYAEVDRLSTRFAHSLSRLGISAGDTVVSMLDNNIDAIICWLAANKLSAISVPINTALRGEFLRHQIADSKTNIVICEAEYVERIAQVAPDISELKRVLYRGTLSDLSPCAIDVWPLDKHRGEEDTSIATKPHPWDLSCIVYTSGTTGPSKGCMLSYNYMCNLARLQLRAGPATEKDVTITPLPLFHMNALCVGVISNILVGARVAIIPRFSVSNFWPEVERSGATIASILGGMGGLLAQAPDNEAMLRCHGQIHTVRGNPFTEESKKIWRERFGAKQVGGNGYGLTEASVITSLPGGMRIWRRPQFRHMLQPFKTTTINNVGRFFLIMRFSNFGGNFGMLLCQPRSKISRRIELAVSRQPLPVQYLTDPAKIDMLFLSSRFPCDFQISTRPCSGHIF